MKEETYGHSSFDQRLKCPFSGSPAPIMAEKQVGHILGDLKSQFDRFIILSLYHFFIFPVPFHSIPKEEGLHSLAILHCHPYHEEEDIPEALSYPISGVCLRYSFSQRRVACPFVSSPFLSPAEFMAGPLFMHPRTLGAIKSCFSKMQISLVADDDHKSTAGWLAGWPRGAGHSTGLLIMSFKLGTKVAEIKLTLILVMLLRLMIYFSLLLPHCPVQQTPHRHGMKGKGRTGTSKEENKSIVQTCYKFVSDNLWA